MVVQVSSFPNVSDLPNSYAAWVPQYMFSLKPSVRYRRYSDDRVEHHIRFRGEVVRLTRVLQFDKDVPATEI